MSGVSLQCLPCAHGGKESIHLPYWERCCVRKAEIAEIRFHAEIAEIARARRVHQLPSMAFPARNPMRLHAVSAAAQRACKPTVRRIAALVRVSC